MTVHVHFFFIRLFILGCRLHTCTCVHVHTNHVVQYMTTCVHTGVHELAVETWRPCGRGVVDMLRRFFVGGATELNDISYITKPADFEVVK